ncbi:enoyl-CoA hydratase-related protein, partial [Chloroflexota bacterium]
MEFHDIVIEKRGRIVCLTLNRPEALNTHTAATTKELAEAITEYRDNPDEWAMIITGAGEKAFSAGADIKKRTDQS